jgi:hypothetical protein
MARMPPAPPKYYLDENGQSTVAACIAEQRQRLKDLRANREVRHENSLTNQEIIRLRNLRNVQEEDFKGNKIDTTKDST